MTEAFCQHAKLGSCFAKPYIAPCDNNLMKKLAFDCHKGITATAPGFYAPQGRWLTIEPAIDDINGILTSFEYKTNKILNFEMETSAIYGLSKLLGHNALTLCLIIANRQSGTFLNDYKDRMKALIGKPLFPVMRTVFMTTCFIGLWSMDMRITCFMSAILSPRKSSWQPRNWKAIWIRQLEKSISRLAQIWRSTQPRRCDAWM